MVFVNRTPHQLIHVEDTDGDRRSICKCQLEQNHITDDGRVKFPVYECPDMSRKYGLGTQNGIQ